MAHVIPVVHLITFGLFLRHYFSRVKVEGVGMHFGPKITIISVRFYSYLCHVVKHVLMNVEPTERDGACTFIISVSVRNFVMDKSISQAVVAALQRVRLASTIRHCVDWETRGRPGLLHNYK